MWEMELYWNPEWKKGLSGRRDASQKWWTYSNITYNSLPISFIVRKTMCPRLNPKGSLLVVFEELCSDPTGILLFTRTIFYICVCILHRQLISWKIYIFWRIFYFFIFFGRKYFDEVSIPRMGPTPITKWAILLLFWVERINWNKIK